MWVRSARAELLGRFLYIITSCVNTTENQLLVDMNDREENPQLYSNRATTACTHLIRPSLREKMIWLPFNTDAATSTSLFTSCAHIMCLLVFRGWTVAMAALKDKQMSNYHFGISWLANQLITREELVIGTTDHCKMRERDITLRHRQWGISLCQVVLVYLSTNQLRIYRGRW